MNFRAIQKWVEDFRIRKRVGDLMFGADFTHPDRLSNASVSPIGRPRGSSVDPSRRSDGSATAKNGERDARGASVWLSGGTVSIAAGTKVTME